MNVKCSRHERKLTKTLIYMIFYNYIAIGGMVLTLKIVGFLLAKKGRSFGVWCTSGICFAHVQQGGFQKASDTAEKGANEAPSRLLPRTRRVGSDEPG